MWGLTKFKIKGLTKRLKSMQQSRVHNQPSEDALKKEIAGYHKLAGIFQSLHGKKKYPFARQMWLECFRAASTLDDTAAQYILGKSLLTRILFKPTLKSLFLQTLLELAY